MSWLSKQIKSATKIVTNPKKWVENAGRTVGKGAQFAAPFLPPGFRELASVGGSIVAGGNRMDHLKSGVGAYIGGQMGGQAVGQGIGGLLKGGIRGIPGEVAKQGGWKSAGVNLLKNKLGLPTGGPGEVEQDTYFNPETGVTTRRDGSVVQPGEPGYGGGSSGGGGWLDILKGLGGSALNFAKSNPDLLLAGGGALLSAKDHADAQKRKDRAFGQLEGEYAKKAPLRDLSLSMLTKDDPRLARLPAMFRNGNPYEARQ